MGAYDLNQRNQPRRNPNPNPKQSIQNRNRFPQKKKTINDTTTTTKKLVLGEVKILKRGEDLNVFAKAEKKKADDLVVATVVPASPEPVKVTRQGWVEDSYAGSAIYSSPSPRSLPLPSFFMKKTKTLFDASNELQRLLRLEL